MCTYTLTQWFYLEEVFADEINLAQKEGYYNIVEKNSWKQPGCSLTSDRLDCAYAMWQSTCYEFLSSEGGVIKQAACCTTMFNQRPSQLLFREFS